MHDLALAFGEQVPALKRRMSEREFARWSRYAAQKGMPWRRIEVQLARIAMLIDLGLGGAKRARLRDYMGETLEELVTGRAAVDEVLIDEVESAFGSGTVIRRGGNG